MDPRPPGRDPPTGCRIGDVDPWATVRGGHQGPSLGREKTGGGDIDRLQAADLEDAVEPAARQSGQAPGDASRDPDRPDLRSDCPDPGLGRGVRLGSGIRGDDCVCAAP